SSDLEVEAPVRPITANSRAFRAMVRNEMFRRVESAARHAYTELGRLAEDDEWDAEAWEEALADYFDEHESIGIGPDARGPHMLQIEQEEKLWRVRQVLAGPEDDHDWGSLAGVDLAEPDGDGRAVSRVTEVERLYSPGAEQVGVGIANLLGQVGILHHGAPGRAQSFGTVAVHEQVRLAPGEDHSGNRPGQHEFAAGVRPRGTGAAGLQR